MNVDFDSAWQDCQKTFRQLRENTIKLREAGRAGKLLNPQEYMATYQKIYSMCVVHSSNNPQRLYKRFSQECAEYMSEVMRFLSKAKDILLLKEQRSIWMCYRLFLKPCRNLFGYLDKFYVVQTNQLPLMKKGLRHFVEVMFENQQFEDAQNIYIAEVEKIRQTQDFGNCCILKEYIEIFREINSTYSVCDSQLATLERRYVESAGEHYRRKYREFEKLSCGEYLSAVDELYKRELNLFEKSFAVTTAVPALNSKFSLQLIKKYKASLLQKSTGLLWMLENQQTHSLRLLNDLYRRLDNFDDLRAKFSEYSIKNLQQYLDRKREQFAVDTSQHDQKLKSEMQFIRSLFKYHKDQTQQLEQSFPGNNQIQLSYKFAIEKVFNSYNRSYGISDILAKYTDSIIRDKKLQQEGFEEEMKHIFGIFSCLVDKDVFIKSYTQLLAKRLVSDSYSNLDFESSFKSKLKQICGVISVQPIDNLLSDFNVSQKESENFHKFLLERHRRQDFRVRLLSRGIWPTEQPLELELFGELHRYNDIFTQYFQAHFKFKTFKWSHLQSRVVLTYYIDDSLKGSSKYEEYDLNMNGLQAALLYFVYQKRGEHAVSQNTLLKQFSKVPAELAVGSIRMLTAKNVNVIKLTRNELSGEFGYEFNTQLLPKRKCLVYEQYTKQTQEQRVQEVQNDRSLAVSMAIVKVMKARRRMKFEALVNEVGQLLRNFQPSVRLIKESIEKMVQKDYLQRDSKDISQYRYKQ